MFTSLRGGEYSFNFNPFTFTGFNSGDRYGFVENVQIHGNTVFSFNADKENITIFPPKASVYFDMKKTYQTIEGFGGFGFRNVNWADPETWWTNDWGDSVINDLGLTFDGNARGRLDQVLTGLEIDGESGESVKLLPCSP